MFPAARFAGPPSPLSTPEHFYTIPPSSHFEILFQGVLEMKLISTLGDRTTFPDEVKLFVCFLVQKLHLFAQCKQDEADVGSQSSLQELVQDGWEVVKAD